MRCLLCVVYCALCVACVCSLLCLFNRVLFVVCFFLFAVQCFLFWRCLSLFRVSVQPMAALV